MSPATPDSEGTRTLFDRVTDHPRNEWEGLLAAATREGTDAAVIAQVRNLLGLVSVAESLAPDKTLAALGEQREHLERLVGSPGERRVTPLPVHSTVGAYHLEEVIGEGGFAVVYRAMQTEPVRRTVAVKVLKTGSHSAEMMRRFQQEQQSLAAMNHPNVAAVIDAGVSAEGWPYFVMEHVAGAPITRYCDDKRMTIRERLELFIPVCEAVQHAHHKGIIHRDLKPSNVLICEIEGRAGGVPKVIDFGVARVVDQSRGGAGGTGGATEGGAIVGTPEYMSPEQAAGEQMDVDTRSDVYSLGVMLYELLTGLLPFDPATLRSGGYGEVLRMIREVEPATPSTRLVEADKAEARLIAGVRGSSRERLTSELGRELELIPLKAMRKARERRYDTAMVMADDLRRYLAGQSLVAGPETKRYRAAKFVVRNRGAVAGAGIVAAAIIVGLVVSLAALRNARKAEAGERIAKNEALEAGQKTQESLRDLLRLTSEAGDPKRMLELLDLAIRDGVGDEVELRLYKVAALDAAYRPLEASQELALLEAREDLGDRHGIVMLWRGDLELIGIIGPRTGVNPETKINEAIEAGLPPAEDAYARGLIATDYDGAKAAFEECVRIDATHLRGQLMLGLVEVLGGEVERGRARAAAMGVRAPGNPSPPALEAIALMLLGRTSECEPLVRRVGEICGEEQGKLVGWSLQKLDRARELLAQGDQAGILGSIWEVMLKLPAIMRTRSAGDLPIRLPGFVSARTSVGEIMAGILPVLNDPSKADMLVSKLAEAAPGLRPAFKAVRAHRLYSVGDHAGAERVALEAIDLPATLNVDVLLLSIALKSAHAAYIKNGDNEAKIRGATIGRNLVKTWEPTNAGDWALARCVAECGEVACARMMLDALERKHGKNRRALGPIVATRVIVECHDGNDAAVLRHALRVPSVKALGEVDVGEFKRVVEGAMARLGPSLSSASPPIDAEVVRKHVGLDVPAGESRDNAQQPPPK